LVQLSHNYNLLNQKGKKKKKKKKGTIGSLGEKLAMTDINLPLKSQPGIALQLFTFKAK